MILINVRFTVRPERVDGWLDFARPFTEATRSEPGNLWFDWYRSTENPQEFFLCEAFRDGDAPEHHVNSQHFADFTAAAPEWLEETPRIVNTTAEGDAWGEMGEIAVD